MIKLLKLKKINEIFGGSSRIIGYLRYLLMLKISEQDKLDLPKDLNEIIIIYETKMKPTN